MKVYVVTVGYEYYATFSTENLARAFIQEMINEQVEEIIDYCEFTNNDVTTIKVNGTTYRIWEEKVI